MIIRIAYNAGGGPIVRERSFPSANFTRSGL
jgi:hypothetical protein